jgi:SPP1 family predicted phage head-tail adaptor
MGCKDFKDICIGDFRHRITIEEPSLVDDAQGGKITTWSTFTIVSAKIQPMRAQQIFFAQQNQHQVSHKITMRYVSGLQADMRVSYDGRIFHIREIKDLFERKRFHEVTAWENKQS